MKPLKSVRNRQKPSREGSQEGRRPQVRQDGRSEAKSAGKQTASKSAAPLESKFEGVQLIHVSEHNEGQRIDNYLLTLLKGVPKSRVYRILRKGEVRVNKKRAKPEYRLHAGDLVRIPPVRLAEVAAPAQASPKLGEFLKQRVLYEDKNLLILNKPSGMAVHGGSGIDLGIIEVLRQFQPHDTFLELVHRLDKDTSGCLMIAKKPSVLKQLHELLRNGQVVKVYQALVKGYWPKHLVQVDVSLQKFQLSSGERMVKVNPEGKEALTEFKVKQRFSQCTLMEAKLHTGRTHQIRVHTAYAGHPVVGDEKYGDKEFNKQMKAYACKRLFLHASYLRFKLPDALAPIEVEAELDPELQLCLSKLR